MQTDRSIVQLALDDDADLWSFTDSVLYEMCRRHPKHTDPLKVVAKVFLIGRAYTAQVERRRNATESLVEFLRDRVALAIVSSNIDSWLASIQGINRLTHSEVASVLAVHNSLVETLQSATGQSNRSLASKYLHFHLPNLFPIFDSKADGELRQWAPHRRVRASCSPADAEYAKFVDKWLSFRDSLEQKYSVELSPRHVDRILLGNAGSARSR